MSSLQVGTKGALSYTRNIIIVTQGKTLEGQSIVIKVPPDQLFRKLYPFITVDQYEIELQLIDNGKVVCTIPFINKPTNLTNFVVNETPYVFAASVNGANQSVADCFLIGGVDPTGGTFVERQTFPFYFGAKCDEMRFNISRIVYGAIGTGVVGCGLVCLSSSLPFR